MNGYGRITIFIRTIKILRHILFMMWIQTDTLINKKGLRRFYYFNASSTEKIQLIPADYAVVRSQYDPKNDVMF